MSFKIDLSGLSKVFRGSVANPQVANNSGVLPLNNNNYYSGIEIQELVPASKYAKEIADLAIVYDRLPMPDTKNIKPLTAEDLAFADVEAPAIYANCYAAANSEA